MKRKVLSDDLTLGMYVAELDRSWESAPFESPFDLQGFTIQNVEELLKVQKLCRYVYIDPNLGVGAKRYLSDEHQFNSAIHIIQETAAAAPLEEYYPEKMPIEKEMVRATEILDDTRRVYDQVLRDIESGNKVDTSTVKNVVGTLVESVLRNSSAASWLVRLKKQDETAYSHSISVCVLGLTLGRFLGLSTKQLNVLGMATLLQDIGKLSIPRYLLSKVERLDASEFELIKQHVHKSISVIRSMDDVSNQIIAVTAAHHERFDGTGYPRGLSRSEIDPLSSIAGLVDTYEAMIANRPYRRAKTGFEALMELYDERDRAHPGGLIEQFIQCVGIFPVGGFVKLNTGEIAVVVQRNQIVQLKPRVMILTDPKGNKLPHPQTLDLSAQFVLPARMPRMISKIVDPKDCHIDPQELFL
jgi:HD-GYP domain-containing protein (c-di-GMP phosphodiesterase class II)